jgi:hypothetical protein
MTDSDEGLKLIPVAEFEGEFVRTMEGKLPAITLDMPEGYARGTHLVLNVEARVRNVGYNEDKKGDLVRQHTFALEEVRLVDAFDPAHRPTNVGGTLAADEEPWLPAFLDFLDGAELDFDGEEIPDRLREILKIYAERTSPTSAEDPDGRPEVPPTEWDDF